MGENLFTIPVLDRFIGLKVHFEIEKGELTGTLLKFLKEGQTAGRIL